MVGYKKCKECLANYPKDCIHSCDGLMKELVLNKKKQKEGEEKPKIEKYPGITTAEYLYFFTGITLKDIAKGEPDMVEKLEEEYEEELTLKINNEDV